MLHNLELTPYQRTRAAQIEETPVVSRGLVIGMLLLLLCGQAMWVVKRFAPVALAAEAPTAAASTRLVQEETAAALPPSRPTVKARTQGAALAPKTDAGAEIAPERLVASSPVHRQMRATDICLALAGALPQVSLTLDADRRAALLDTLTQMQRAGENGKQATDQARAAFSQEQLSEMLALIGQEPYASMQGADLDEKAREVLVKIAEGAEAPATIDRPLPDAASLTFDQILRGALALENTSVMLSRSQAAQIEAARADLENARKRQQLWRKQLIGQITPEEYTLISSHLTAITPGDDARALKNAVAALSALQR